MALENLVFDVEGGVRIKLKPELIVNYNDPILSPASVPVTVYVVVTVGVVVTVAPVVALNPVAGLHT